jgi:hypothetical protein
MSSENLSRSKTTFRYILILMTVVCLTSRLVVVNRPLSFLDGITLPDDTYLSLHIARSIAEGKGPLYDDNYTNGFQPLYVFLMAPVYFFSEDQVESPVKIALVLLALFDSATLIVLMLFIRKLTNTLVAAITALLWIFNPYVIETSLNGLETIMASFFIAWASYYYYTMYHTNREKGISDFVKLGIITGFACLTRVDSLLFAFVLGVFILVHEYKNNSRTFIVRPIYYGASALFVFSIWAIYSIYYTGTWYPESGKAVRLISLNHADYTSIPSWLGKMFWEAFIVEARTNGYLLIIIFIQLVYVLSKKLISFDTFKNIGPLLIFCISTFFAYTCYIFTFWYFHRYFFPFTILYIMIFAQLSFLIINAKEERTHQVISVSIILLLWFVPLFVKGKFVNFYVGEDNNQLGYRNIGIWAAEKFPKGTVVGTTQSGALGYFATDLKVVNLDGVVNRECYKALVDGKCTEYIKKSKIEYVLEWEEKMDLIKMFTTEKKESDFTKEKKIDSFQSWNHDWYLYRVNY